MRLPDQRTRLAAVLLLALALRAYPLHVFYLHPDQDSVPRMAMRALVEGDWRPAMLIYPQGLMVTLRALYGVAYAIGHATGAFRDRIDLLAAFVERPYPFLLVARLLSCLLGVATVALAARLGKSLGAGTGLLGALFLAVTFLHVRESHYGSLDVPAAAFTVAALVAGEASRRTDRLRPVVLAAVASGLAAAHRYQLGVIALVVPVAGLLRTGTSRAATVRRILLAALVAAAVFALLDPYVVLEPAHAWRDVRSQLGLSYGLSGPRALGLSTAFTAAAGLPLCVLALVGAILALRSQPRPTLAVVLPLLPYLAAVAAADRLFVRYTVPLLPVLAVMAGVAVEALGAALPRRLAPAMTAIVVLVAIADPLARSVMLDRVLAREDTRLAAGRWIVDHVPSGETIAVPGTGWYANPILPETRGDLAWHYGPRLAAMLVRHGVRSAHEYALVAYGGQGDRADVALVPGRLVATTEHPGLPAFGLVPPSLEAALATHADAVATFVGFRDAVPTLFDPIDANYVPLRGFGAVVRPGPNITLWRVREGQAARTTRAP